MPRILAIPEDPATTEPSQLVFWPTLHKFRASEPCLKGNIFVYSVHFGENNFFLISTANLFWQNFLGGSTSFYIINNSLSHTHLAQKKRKTFFKLFSDSSQPFLFLLGHSDFFEIFSISPDNVVLYAGMAGKKTRDNWSVLSLVFFTLRRFD